MNHSSEFQTNIFAIGDGAHPHLRGHADTITGHAARMLIALTFVALASVFLSGPTQAQSGPAQPAIQNGASSPIGKVVAATGSVTIEHSSAVVVQANLHGQAGQTKVGDPVYQGDMVRTGSDGRVSINFADDTSFNLSSNANMTLDEFVYDPNGKSNSTVFNLGKGAFTFVAGKIAKTGDMKVETPVATMGIRGTTPHVEIAEDGTAKFTTLIEEGKSKVTKKLTAPLPPQQTQPEQKLKLNICRGC